MGAGKSTVGQLLASELDWDFLDVDKQIEASEGMSAKELFAALGEAAFRIMESDVLVSCMSRPNAIIAPGGAAIDFPRNRQVLASRSNTLIVFLDAPFETLIARCLLDEQRGCATYRPLLHMTDMALARFSARRSLYSAHADLTIDVAEPSPDGIVSLICETMRGLREQA
jgi:shikimate kinase